METTTLRWFLAVAEGATVAEAAERFHMTQPAVSRGLARLSDELGQPLLERRGRRLALTFAGRLAADGARRMLAEHDTLARSLAEADDPAHGTVRIGFLNPLGAWLIPRLITAFRAEHPDVGFQLRQDGASRNRAALLAGELDLVLGEAADDLRRDAGLAFEPLFEEDLVLLLPAGHRLSRRQRVRIDELADEPWVVQPEGHGLRQRAERLCAAAGFTPRRAFEGHDLGTLYALVAADCGIGVFASRPEPGPGVVRVPLSPRQHRTVGLLTRPGGVIPSAATAFRALVRERAPAIAGASARTAAPGSSGGSGGELGSGRRRTVAE